MSAFQSTLVQNERLLPGIHGLRGLAALAVVLYHLVHIGGFKPPEFFNFIGRDFGYSVHLFFIVSAYSLMHSTRPKANEFAWLKNYFLKRFFRIAPLFYCMVLFFLVLIGRQPITNVILSLTFTFGFIPSSGFVWGSWSVGVEMIFYAVFPILLLLIRSDKTALVFLIVSTITSSVLRSAMHYEYTGMNPSAKFDWSYFSFAPNFCFFVMGIYVYLVGKTYNIHHRLIRVYTPLIACLIIGGLLSGLGSSLFNTYRLDIAIWGIGLAMLTLWQGSNPSRLVANRFFEYLGERSFSIYMLHPIVIYTCSKTMLVNIYAYITPYIGQSAYFIVSALTIILVLIAAEVTYKFIEIPGIEFGRKLIRKET